MRALLLVMVVMLVVCCTAPLRYVPPQPRTGIQAERATVTILTSCSTVDPFPGPHEFAPRHTTNWYSGRGTGVAISERHVVTARHVVYGEHGIGCGPFTLSVWIVLRDGRSMRAWIDRRDPFDRADPSGGVVKLSTLGDMGIGVAPPTLGSGDSVHYHIATRRGLWIGDRTRWSRKSLGPGDSGAGVYSHAGELVGVLLGGPDEHGWLRFARVDETWMKGI